MGKIVPVIAAVDQNRQTALNGLVNRVHRGVIHMKPLDVGMDLDAVKPQLNAAFDFIHWVFQPRVDGAEADEPVRMLLASGMDKIVDALHLPGHRGHRLDYEHPHAGFTAAFQQGFHTADFVHGNRIKFSDAVRGLFCNFIRINMGVKINNIHHDTVLLSVQRYENFHRFQFLTIKTQFIILSEDAFFCQEKDYL